MKISLVDEDMVITDEKKIVNLMSGYFVNTTKKAKFKTLSMIDCDCNLDLFEIDANSYSNYLLKNVWNRKSKIIDIWLYSSKNLIYFDVYLFHQEC